MSKAKEGPKLVPTVAELEAKIAQFKSELEEARKRDLITTPAQDQTPPPTPATEPTPPMFKLDLGCGKSKKEGFVGVDSIAFPGVDVVCDLAREVWPWKDGSVEEAYSSHSREHIPAKERARNYAGDVYPRAHFFNELWRVLKPGGKATFITPHWCSNRAYGDVTHEWPPISEMFYWYLNKAWRETNAPHQDFWKCDFDTVQPGYSMHPSLQTKNQDYRELALTFGKEAAQDMICTVIKRG